MGLPNKLLNALQAYGDSFLDNGDEDRAQTREASPKKSKHNKGKKRTKKDAQYGPAAKLPKVTELDRMRIDLGLDNIVENEPSLPAEQPRPIQSVPVVVFQDPTKRKAKGPPRFKEQEEETTVNKVKQIDFRKAKYDVIKFGIKGLEKPAQEEAKVALAVQLGAKPPKNKYVNYKELIEERKRRKALAVEQRETNARMGVKPKKPATSQGKEKHSEKHDGVHHVSKKLISKVQRKGSRTR